MPLTVLAVTEAQIVRWIFWGLALAAILYGIYHVMKRDPPGRDAVFAPTRR